MIEIICTVIGAVGVILTGVWFIVQRAQKMAVNDYRLNTLGDVCYALSLPLRDMYLEAHPEIPR